MVRTITCKECSKPRKQHASSVVQLAVQAPRAPLQERQQLTLLQRQ